MLHPPSICRLFAVGATLLGMALLPSPTARAQDSSGAVTLSGGMFMSSGTLTTVGSTLALAGGTLTGGTITGGTLMTNSTATTGTTLASGTYTLSNVTLGSSTLLLASDALASGSFTFTGNTIAGGNYTLTGDTIAGGNYTVTLYAFGPSFFSGEVDLGSQVCYLALPNGSPFGYYSHLGTYHTESSGSSYASYLYHFDMGYEYALNAIDGRGGVYLYDFASQTWFYTSSTFPFPYLYDFSLKTVLYYYPDANNPGRYNTDGVRYFYNFATGQIITK